MRKVFRRILQYAESDRPVLITGPIGSGKELTARALHHHSRRKGRFVPVNCAAVSKTLAESEFFGHKRGAFTGALTDRAGWFQEAQDGTLFLDEIGDMPVEQQAILLRAIQERCIIPVGATRPTDVSFRLVAATNRDLPSAIASRFTYSFDDSPLIRLDVDLAPEKAFAGFELYLSSYVLTRRHQPHFWCTDRDTEASWVAPAEDRFTRDYYVAFPRDNHAAALTFDGRWGNSPYQTFLNGPYYAEPVMAVPDDERQSAYVEMGHRNEVAKICGTCSRNNWTPEAAFNNDTRLYTVLFGRDIAPGESLHAMVRAGVIPIAGDLDHAATFAKNLLSR